MLIFIIMYGFQSIYIYDIEYMKFDKENYHVITISEFLIAIILTIINSIMLIYFLRLFKFFLHYRQTMITTRIKNDNDYDSPNNY